MAARDTIGKQLAQVRPADTTAVSAYSPDADTQTEITRIYICNNTGSAATYRIFHDEDGTTYDESTALFFDNNCAANVTEIIGDGETTAIQMANSAGNLAVRVGTGSAITFTIYGIEEKT